MSQSWKYTTSRHIAVYSFLGTSGGFFGKKGVVQYMPSGHGKKRHQFLLGAHAGIGTLTQKNGGKGAPLGNIMPISPSKKQHRYHFRTAFRRQVKSRLSARLGGIGGSAHTSDTASRRLDTFTEAHAAVSYKRWQCGVTPQCGCVHRNEWGSARLPKIATPIWTHFFLNHQNKSNQRFHMLDV